MIHLIHKRVIDLVVVDHVHLRFYKLKTRFHYYSVADSQEKYDHLKEHLVNTDIFFAQVYAESVNLIIPQPLLNINRISFSINIMCR